MTQTGEKIRCLRSQMCGGLNPGPPRKSIHWLGQKHLQLLRVFSPPLWLSVLGSHADWVTRIDLGIIYICHLTPLCLWFQETQDTLWPCVLSLCPLWFFLPARHSRLSHRGVCVGGGDRWGRARRLRVAIFMWAFAVFLHCFLSWSLTYWLSWTLMLGVKIKPDVLCLPWSAD